MNKFELPQKIMSDTYQVSNGNSLPSAWECKEGDPGGTGEPSPSGGWQSIGNSWCD